MNCSFIKNSAHISSKGFMYPCTVSDLEKGVMGKICNTKFEEVFKHKLNVSSDICYRCIENESITNASFSKWKNSSNEEHFLIDIRLDNNCNFRCISCNGKNSLSFKVEDKKTKYTSLFDILFKNIDFIRRFKRVYIGGGEPFLAKNLKEFLNLLNKEQEILISSNISIIKDDILSDLHTFKKVIFYPSIDHIYEKGEYIRFGFNQKVFDKNLETLLKQFECVPVITISALNVIDLNKIINHLSKFTDKNNCYFNILDFPKEMHVSVLPDFLKAKAIANLNLLKNDLNPDFVIDAPYNPVNGINLILKKISYNNCNLFDNLINTLKEKDNLRNNSYKILFDGML